MELKNLKVAENKRVTSVKLTLRDYDKIVCHKKCEWTLMSNLK